MAGREKLLSKRLLDEYAEWTKRFPNEFYQEMFRLKNWQWKGMSAGKPGIVGRYTINIVYSRMPKEIFAELKRRNPKNEEGRRTHKYHQWLTLDTGIVELDKHLHTAIALMRASANWGQFERLLARSMPKNGEQIPLALEEGN